MVSILKGAFSKMKSAMKIARNAAESSGKKAAASVNSAIKKSAEAGLPEFIKNDVSVKAAGSIARGVGLGAKTTANTARNISRKLSTPTIKRIGKPILKAVGTGGFLLGAVGMLGYNIMNGGMSQARDTVQERYLQDYSYSKNILHNSRVGLASGTSTMLNKSGTQGLSLALHKTRHN